MWQKQQKTYETIEAFVAGSAWHEDQDRLDGLFVMEWMSSRILLAERVHVQCAGPFVSLHDGRDSWVELPCFSDSYLIHSAFVQ